MIAPPKVASPRSRMPSSSLPPPSGGPHRRPAHPRGQCCERGPAIPMIVGLLSDCGETGEWTRPQ